MGILCGAIVDYIVHDDGDICCNNGHVVATGGLVIVCVLLIRWLGFVIPTLEYGI